MLEPSNAFPGKLGKAFDVTQNAFKHLQENVAKQATFFLAMASLYRNSDTYGTITAEYSPAISAGPLMSSKKLSDYKVVIAYDFGTTYSGAAYAFTHTETPEVFDVLKW